MPRLAIKLLGPFQVHLDGQPGDRFGYAKSKALLAYLAAESRRAHPRQAVAALLWPERSERNARQNLSQALLGLRRAISDPAATPPFLLATPQDVQFNPASDHWLDVHEFDQLLAACERHEHASAATCASCLERLQEAAALYAGEFLEDLALADSAGFEEWAERQRERYHLLMVETLDRLADGYEVQGDATQALQCARRQVELDPWREEAHQRVMRLLALSGERSAALAQYETCRRLLRDELGVEPSTETQALLGRIQSGEITMSPPLDARAGDLPLSLIPLVGRQAELADLTDRLRDPHCRLLTLVGPGGVGKTRLALEGGAELASAFPRGVHFVPLSPVDAADGIASAIAQGLGFSFYPQAELETAAKRQLLEYLRERELLLILDSFEHLLAGAALVGEILASAAGVKVLVTTRARLNIPGEHVLPLSGMAYPMHPQEDASGYAAVQLFLESARRIRPGYAPTAQDLDSIGELCRSVEGMPLAILLAASWMSALSPREIAAEMEGEDGQMLDALEIDSEAVPQRQRSMRAVFHHSWRLLSEREQRILNTLAVFRGGFTREAALEVAGAKPRDLLRLVDRSLVQRMGESRYVLHDLLRQYAMEQLQGVPGALETAGDRHAAYYARAARAWQAERAGPHEERALQAIQSDLLNLHLAWEWASSHGRPEWIDPLIDPLRGFYVSGLRLSEGEAWFRAAAERLRAAIVPRTGIYLRVLAQVLLAQVFLAEMIGQPVAAQALLDETEALLAEAERAGEEVRPERATLWRQRLDGERSLAEARVVGHRALEANALFGLGQQRLREGRLEEARLILEKHNVLWRALGAQSHTEYSLRLLCLVALRQGRIQEAERRLLELEALLGTMSDREQVAAGRTWLGCGLMGLGRFPEARALYAENASFWEEAGNRYALALDLCRLGEAEMLLAHYPEAKATLERGIEIAEALGVGRRLEDYPCGLRALLALAEGELGEAVRYRARCLAAYRRQGREACFWAQMVRGHVSMALGHLEEARQAYRGAVQASQAIDALDGSGWDLWSGLALLLARQGEAERAVELYALARRDPFVAHSCWHEQVCGRPIAAAAASLSPEVLRAAEQRGRARDYQATRGRLLAELESEAVWAERGRCGPVGRTGLGAESP